MSFCASVILKEEWSFAASLYNNETMSADAPNFVYKNLHCIRAECSLL